MQKMKRWHDYLKKNSKLYWQLRENFVILKSNVNRFFDLPIANKKPRILFYHIDSLGYSGTSKFLQILAKNVDQSKFDVFYLYPNKISENVGFLDRYNYLKESNISLIPFDFKFVSQKVPYFIYGMNPDVKSLIKTLNIDLLVTPAAGAAQYPFSNIKNIPIILLNIFGEPNVQKNIKYHICISKEVAKKITRFIPAKKISVMPIPTENPDKAIQDTAALELRRKLNIADSDLVFGRIGRADNNIHDSIGIEAFKLALKTNPNIHYLIMSPPPILVDQVTREKIPHVYFIEPSSKEEDIWSFHAAIDVLAHFRNDGESFGLNIAESMLVGNPIITHKSHIWNAHLEYLDNSFARVADRNDVDNYAAFMNEFVSLKNTAVFTKMREAARQKAEKLFLIQNNIAQFEALVQSAIAK